MRGVGAQGRITIAVVVGRPIENDPYLAAVAECCPNFAVELLHPQLETAAIDAGLARSSALLLTGGADIHPERYGEPPDGSEMKSVQRARDALELPVLAHADAAGWPVLALCRGMQMLNIHRGGALLQDIGESHRLTPRPAKADLWRPLHRVELVDGTVLRTAVGLSSIAVNSRHHQAIDPARLGAGVRIVATAADGIAEAVEVPGKRFVVGVQWHPENMVFAPAGSEERASARAIFSAFERAVLRPVTTDVQQPA